MSEVDLYEYDYLIVRIKGKYLSLERDEAPSSSTHPLAKFPSVDQVRPSSTADKAGLKLGDHVLSVNGHRTNKKTNEELIEFITGHFDQKLTLVVLRKATGAPTDAPDVRVEVAEQPESIDNTKTSSTQNTAERIPAEPSKDEEIQRVRLCKIEFDSNDSNDQNLGFTIGRVASRPGLYRIAEIVADSPAHSSGLKVNDFVLEISGQNARILAYEDLLNLLKAKKQENDLEFLVTQFMPPQTEDFEKARTVKMQPKSSMNIFGFSISECEKGPHRINEVEPGSSAEKSGLKSNDLILKVNGFNCIGMQFYRVSELINRECEKGLLNFDVIDADKCPQEILNFPQYDTSLSLRKTSSTSLTQKDGEETKSENAAQVESHVKQDGEENILFVSIKSNGKIASLGVGLSSGSIVTHIEKSSLAELNGLKLGDKIVQVNEIDVREKSKQEIAALIKKHYQSKIVLGVVREKQQQEQQQQEQQQQQQQQQQEAVNDHQIEQKVEVERLNARNLELRDEALIQQEHERTQNQEKENAESVATKVNSENDLNNQSLNKSSSSTIKQDKEEQKITNEEIEQQQQQQQQQAITKVTVEAPHEASELNESVLSVLEQREHEWLSELDRLKLAFEKREQELMHKLEREIQERKLLERLDKQRREHDQRLRSLKRKQQQEKAEPKLSESRSTLNKSAAELRDRLAGISVDNIVNINVDDGENVHCFSI